ncbi:MAG: hypothetical protein LBK67_00110 [Coriobacteriales bacterium]|jgi:hypothetical protein|nr:hypothetical protein [Coriobacteriales bacterium]
MTDIDFETYERMADELPEDDERSRYVDTTNEPEFLLMKIAAFLSNRISIFRSLFCCRSGDASVVIMSCLHGNQPEKSPYGGLPARDRAGFSLS